MPDRMRDPFLFEEILAGQQKIFTGSGILDLSHVSFVEPYSMVSLLLLGRNYLRGKGEKLKLINIPLPVHQYFARMDFFDQGIFEAEPLDSRSMLKRSSFSSRVIEITEIPGKERQSISVINSVIARFRKRASFILKYWMNGQVVDYFVTVISELCQNIFEHSLDSGYLAMQTYSSGMENIFRLSISDSGIGIRDSFAGKENMPDDTAEIIKLALTRPVSSKRPFGFGLCQVNDIVKKMQGSVFIRSDSASILAVYKKNAGSQPVFLKNDLPEFSGTQISVSLFA